VAKYSEKIRKQMELVSLLNDDEQKPEDQAQDKKEQQK
jgi:hypothetical protein